MAKKNKIYDINIHDLGHEGEGIGKAGEYVLFVPGALPGDFCRVKVVKAKKSYGYGKLLEVLKPSEYRVPPLCPVSGKCGGCSLMHLDYKRGLYFKQKKVADSLERIGGFKDVEVVPVVPMDSLEGYRNKAQLPVRERNGIVKIGFYMKNSHIIVEHESCYVQKSVVMEAVNAVKRYMEANNVSAYNEEEKKGIVRHLLVKTGFKTGEVMICLVVNIGDNENIKRQDALISVIRKIEGVKAIVLNYNRAADNVILGRCTKTIWGQDHIIDHIGNMAFKISPVSFFQVNPFQTEKMYQKILELSGASMEDTVLDLYCGIGSISLFLAKSAKKVIGVEIVEQAIYDARENAILNNMENTEFICGKAEEVIYSLINRGGHVDIIVADPPRKGCDEKLLAAVLEMRPKKFVYVSCNPDTLARDLKILCESRYEIEKVCPFDMFGFTNHVETVCLLNLLPL